MTGAKFKRWLMHSTTGRGRHSAGRRRRKCLPTYYSQVHDTVLRPPVEPGQYTSIRFSERLAQAGIQPSVNAVGSSFDNALAETINGYAQQRRRAAG